MNFARPGRLIRASATVSILAFIPFSGAGPAPGWNRFYESAAAENIRISGLKPGGEFGGDAMKASTDYIDGSAGPRDADYDRWGIPDDFFFAITYKNIDGDDTAFLAKAPLVVLDVSQMRAAEEARKLRKSFLPAEDTSRELRAFGYCDGAGISMSLPEFVNRKGEYMVKNNQEQPLLLGGRLYAPGQVIAGSEKWFLRDALGSYYTYWFGTGVMADVSSPLYREWFRSYRLNRVLGVFDYGIAGVISERTLRDAGKSWRAGQWRGYYAGIFDAGEIRWSKILDNSPEALTLESPPGHYTGKYIINTVPLRGFNGVFLDDIWDGILHENEKKSLTESGTCTGAGMNYIVDTSKQWEKNRWKGYRASVADGVPNTVTGNDADRLYFKYKVKAAPGDRFVIKAAFEWDSGAAYKEAMAAFLREMVGHIEDRSTAVYGPRHTARGVVVLNTWLDDWDAYARYADAATSGARNFAMFEALQSTWDMANEVTKQYRIYDWAHVLDRWAHMKAPGAASGTSLRLAVLGYPCTQQMFLSHIAGGLMLADFSGGRPEDIIAAGNITLDNLYYDMITAKNLGTNRGGDAAASSFGKPLGAYSKTGADPYSVIKRDFEGAVIFYNPSRMFRVVEHRFDTDVAGYQTGRTIEKNTPARIFLPPRSAHFYFKNTPPGVTAFNFVRGADRFTYFDYNAAWVIFTTEGARLINGDPKNPRHHSVWMDRGRSHHRRFVLEGGRKPPEGPPERLFHAGDGRGTVVRGFDPESVTIKIPRANAGVRLGEYITGEDRLPVYAVAGVRDGESGALLEPGTDYRIGYIDDAGAPGRGRMDAVIFLLRAGAVKSIRVAYYTQELDADGLPEKDAEIRETGIMYREARDPLFKTGGIGRKDCTRALVPGVHYYLVPEPVRWKWDYRYGITLPREYRTEPLTVTLNDVLRNGANPKAKAIHWGAPELENMVLADPEKIDAKAVNGFKAAYESMEIKKPRLLLYGFRENPVDESAGTIRPSARRYDKWRIESRLAARRGTQFGDVVVTGDHAAGGSWGSIRGFLKSTGMTVRSAQEYFDAVIICENFIEGSTPSPSGKARYGSWLEEEDYLFLKTFSHRSGGKLIIDRRCGANSFVWWGGRVPVRHELLNRGADLNGDGKNDHADLTDVFGVFSFGGMDLKDLPGRGKNASGGGADLRIVEAVRDISDQYTVDATQGVFPEYNPWENDAGYLMYIARSARIDGDAAASEGAPSWTAERLEGLDPSGKPEAILPYEEAYGDRIREFARDFSTGLRTGYSFMHTAGAPPVIVWAGAQDRDLELLVNRWTGTKLIFKNLSAGAGTTLYLYYNAGSDMLQIREGDIGNALPAPYDMGVYDEKEFISNRPLK